MPCLTWWCVDPASWPGRKLGRSAAVSAKYRTATAISTRPARTAGTTSMRLLGTVLSLVCGGAREASQPASVAVAPLAPAAARVDERRVVGLQGIGEAAGDRWRAVAVVLPEGHDEQLA